MIAIIYISLTFIYAICCIADGPDVKPILNRKVGNYLHKQADKWYHAHYCHIDYCPFVMDKFRQLQEWDNTDVRVLYYDANLIKHRVKFNKEQAFMFKSEEIKLNYIKMAKDICNKGICCSIKNRIAYDIFDDPVTGEMTITGSIIAIKPK